MPTAEGTTRQWFGYAGRVLSTQDLAALEITGTILEKAYEICQRERIALVVVFAPTKFRVYADICCFEQDSDIQTWTINDLPQRLRDRVHKISDEIRFFDLTSPLQDAARDGPLLYYSDDSHWSPEGHAIAARSISEALRGNFGDRLSELNDPTTR